MTLADISIRNPVFAWMLMAFLIVFGGICFGRLGVSQMPDVDFPMVRVSLTLEGASPVLHDSVFQERRRAIESLLSSP